MQTKLSKPWIQIIQWGTFLLSIAGIIYVIVAFQKYRYEGYFITLQLNAFLLSIMLFGSVLAFTSSVFLVYGWRSAIELFDREKSPLGKMWMIYGRTILAKYLPGNLFHLPGRHLYAVRYGFSNIPLIGAMFVELANLVLAALWLGIWLLPVYSSTRIVLVLLSLLLWFTSNNWLFRLQLPPVPSGRFRVFLDLLKSSPESMTMKWRRVSEIQISYLLFHVLNGLVFWIILVAIGVKETPVLACVSAYAVSFIAGLLTPGAPAGMGVRETVLILLLAPTTGEPNAILAAVLSRFILIVGDVLFFLSAIWFSIQNRYTIPSQIEDAINAKKSSP